MIEAAIQICKVRSQSRIAGSHKSPDITADRTSFRLREKGIVPYAGKGRSDAALEIVKENAVFAEEVPATVLPELREVIGGKVESALLHGFEPDNLDVQIVIGSHLLRPEFFE